MGEKQRYVEEKKSDKARRLDIINKQSELSPWCGFMPYTCICSCGFDFVDYPKAYEELITGCPKCGRSYCE